MENLRHRDQLKFDMMVYHEKIYNGKEPMKVVGIRKDQVELEGDWSGGTHNVNQKEWMPLDGVLIKEQGSPH